MYRLRPKCTCMHSISLNVGAFLRSPDSFPTPERKHLSPVLFTETPLHFPVFLPDSSSPPVDLHIYPCEGDTVFFLSMHRHYFSRWHWLYTSDKGFSLPWEIVSLQLPLTTEWVSHLLGFWDEGDPSQSIDSFQQETGFLLPGHPEP